MPVLDDSEEVVNNFVKSRANVEWKMRQRGTTLQVKESLVDNVLRRLKRRLAVKDIVQGGKRRKLKNKTAKVIGVFERGGPNESNILPYFHVEVESLGGEQNEKPLKSMSSRKNRRQTREFGKIDKIIDHRPKISVQTGKAAVGHEVNRPKFSPEDGIHRKETTSSAIVYGIRRWRQVTASKTLVNQTRYVKKRNRCKNLLFRGLR
mmetsp:Transcript_60238/g.126026  ORF Transcript_60238/g.126026 Transcript_60238/m.126026 type:complete len:206 (+) Transcript_60238:770-1387(+)